MADLLRHRTSHDQQSPPPGGLFFARAWGSRIAQPDEIGGRETQYPCLIVAADEDAHYARAKAAGAIIVDELESKDFGGKAYGCREPEGHLWWFGTYDPWKG